MCLKTIKDTFFPNMWSVIKIYIYIYIYFWNFNFQFYLKPYVKNLGIPSSLYSFTNLSFFGEKCILPYFLKNKQNSNPHPFCKVGEIQLWSIKTTCFTYLLLKIDPVIIKTLNFKFENVSFTKLRKRLGLAVP